MTSGEITEWCASLTPVLWQNIKCWQEEPQDWLETWEWHVLQWKLHVLFCGVGLGLASVHRVTLAILAVPFQVIVPTSAPFHIQEIFAVESYSPPSPTRHTHTPMPERTFC